jgi:hypothetical protein
MLVFNHLLSRTSHPNPAVASYYSAAVRSKARGNDRAAERDARKQELNLPYPKLVAYAPTNRHMRRAAGDARILRKLRRSAVLERAARAAGQYDLAASLNSSTCQLEALRPPCPGSREVSPPAKRRFYRVRQERRERRMYLSQLVRPFALHEQLAMRAEVKSLGWAQFKAKYQPFVTFTPGKKDGFWGGRV